MRIAELENCLKLAWGTLEQLKPPEHWSKEVPEALISLQRRIYDALYSRKYE